MVTRTVTLFSCDICDAKAEPEDVAGSPRRTTLPKNWVEIVGNSNDRKVLDIQICPDCMRAIQEALLESRDIVERRK